MTEYWVSQGNKWCEHCKIFIANNPTSIRTHEFGTRHTENVTKRLAAMRKDTVAKEKEKQQALKDLTRIEAQALKSYEKDLAAIQDAEKRRADLPHGARRSGAGSPSCPRPTEKKGSDSQGKWSKLPSTLNPKSVKVSSSPEPSKAPAKAVVRGVASSLAIGKRKRENKPGSRSKSIEEAAAIAAREAARRRTEEREKATQGLYQAY